MDSDETFCLKSSQWKILRLKPEDLKPSPNRRSLFNSLNSTRPSLSHLQSESGEIQYGGSTCTFGMRVEGLFGAEAVKVFGSLVQVQSM
jgi:hypothetical protein